MIDHCYVSIKILIGGSFWVYHVSILFKHVHVMIECGNTVPQSGFFLLAVGFQSQISPYNDTQICSDFMRTWHGIRDWCESRSFGPIGPMLRWNQHEDPESGLGKYSNVHSFSLLTTVVEAIFSTPTTKLQKVPHPSTIEQRSRTTSCRRPRGPWCLQNSSPYLAQMEGLDVPTEQYWPSKIATQQKKCINPTPKISKNGCATSGNKLCSESVWSPAFLSNGPTVQCNQDEGLMPALSTMISICFNSSTWGVHLAWETMHLSANKVPSYKCDHLSPSLIFGWWLKSSEELPSTIYFY